MEEQRLGIIDIGSNSVRLVVYERTARGAHRVVDGSKRAARLSQQIDDNGALSEQAVGELIDTLHHFNMICSANRTVLTRTVATAAIRNASNRDEIIERLQNETGLIIELLSGEEEAAYGFLGMINSMEIEDGFLVDIGGGSTELSLFQGRKIIHSVSFPFGCVSMYKKYATKGMLPQEELLALQETVAEALRPHNWVKHSPALPLIGIGGTIRSLGKIHQAANQYPFPLNHNYSIPGGDVAYLLDLLNGMPLDKRKKQPGLSKDRADVILPGLAILQTIYQAVDASCYQICGAGLRDGLFRATRFPEEPKLDQVLPFSIANLSVLHPEGLLPHIAQVNQFSLKLYDALQPRLQGTERNRILLDTASRLFRIGASIDFNDYARHTFYLIIHSQLNGLSHREIILTAAIAAYTSKGRARSLLTPYKDLLLEQDLDLVCRCGSILQLAAALDRSATGAIAQLDVRLAEPELRLLPTKHRGLLTLERNELAGLSADFKKLWGLLPVLTA